MAMIRRGGKHREIAGIILKAADEGRFLTVTEIHESLSYGCAYGSLRKIIKLFEERDWVTKERAGMSVLIKPNMLLYRWFR
ncbi:hypothetical protein EVC20_035 [Rhizobium phage RHph_Y2_17_1]|nr:hypothetical protein EVC19_035 [Rhizobium phage RHph_Y2_11]QIG75774.1 hypothetical protein EVC20_035 [Rhizobium phage RHph_Y2_17_1]